ncbi:MAG: sulfite exporter TauE/SafE family protein [Candidatus Helarchaeota archaeon]
MLEILTYWYMFPVALLIATVAMLFGIGGAIFFSPFFILVLSLDPQMAISLGLLIEVFGFSSGLVGYIRLKLINFHLSTRILPFALIGGILGALVGKYIPAISLEIILAGIIFFLGISFLLGEKTQKYVHYPFHPHIEEYRKAGHLDQRPYLHWLDFWTDFKKKPFIFVTSMIGGVIVGLSSTGLGEINSYNFVKRLKMDLGESAGTSIFIIAIVAIATSLFNISFLFLNISGDGSMMLEILLFTIPGVILGAQIGSKLASRLNREKLLKVLPILFIIIASITILKIILS